MTENESIERDHGTVVGGYRVGGGTRGKRDDQDEAVVEFAERINDEFPHDITIRYNTNRLGGGAWLKDGCGSRQVGLGAELNPPESHKEKFQKYLDGDRDEKPQKDYTVEEMNLVYTVHLLHPAISEEDADDYNSLHDAPYVHKKFEDFEEAWEWFLEHVNRDGVNRPK